MKIIKNTEYVEMNLKQGKNYFPVLPQLEGQIITDIFFTGKSNILALSPNQKDIYDFSTDGNIRLTIIDKQKKIVNTLPLLGSFAKYLNNSTLRNTIEATFFEMDFSNSFIELDTDPNPNNYLPVTVAYCNPAELKGLWAKQKELSVKSTKSYTFSIFHNTQGITRFPDIELLRNKKIIKIITGGPSFIGGDEIDSSDIVSAFLTLNVDGKERVKLLPYSIFQSEFNRRDNEILFDSIIVDMKNSYITNRLNAALSATSYYTLTFYYHD